jgi:hypothetical protein
MVQALFGQRWFRRGGPYLACLLGLALAFDAVAADRLALVVGNDGYQQIERLHNARNDARLMAQLLRDAKFDTTLLEDANRTQLWRAVDTLRSRIRKGDEVVVYFAGHGVQVGADPVLLPVDIVAENENQVARDGLALIRLQEAIKDARFGLLIIDACRNNPFPRKGTRSLGEPNGLAPVEAAEGMAILLSAGRGQRALDTVPGGPQANGLFTHELVRSLRDPEAGVRAALLATRDRVEDAALRVGHKQRPTLVDEMRGDFRIFGPVGSAAGAAGDTMAALPPVAGLQERKTPVTSPSGGHPRPPAGRPPQRKVQLVWDSAGVLPGPHDAEIGAAFVQGLQAAGIALTLPAAADASAGSRPTTPPTHVLRVQVLADTRSPVGAGFLLTLRSTSAQDLLLSHYSLAPPAGPAPARQFRYLATDEGFKKVEAPPPAREAADVGRALADEVKASVKRALE